MFAVPGWSISADALKVQTEPRSSKAATEHKHHNPIGTDKKKSRKRKRGTGSRNALEVTEENLGDLWRKYIEEKNSDQPRPKKEGKEAKQSKQNTEGEDGSLGEIEDVDPGSFEGFSEEDKFAETVEEEASPKKRKRKRKDDKGIAPQANGHDDAADSSPTLLKEQGEAEDGKSKYEQRKAKASKKREQRALLQANGTLPPVRPEAVPSHPAEIAPAKPSQTAKPFGSLKASDTLQDPTVTKSTKLPTAPEPPKSSRAPDTTPTPALSLPSTGLTPLQQRMAAKLTSARFRHLNQTLYTSPSDQAMRLFADSPQNYTSYHAGFRAQVAVWPQNPVQGFIENVRARSRVSVPSQKKLWREQKKGKKPKSSDADATAGATTAQGGEKMDPLPRSRNGICTIVDLGCGDATLAGSLSPSTKSLSLKFLSFDLAKGDTPNAHLVTVADISNLSAAGVKDGTVDIAICCLSLMGTNWVDVVGECARIVRGGGEVWVAEIKSRFARPGVTKKAGGGIGRKKSTDKGKGAVGDEDEDDKAVALEDMEDAKSKGGKDETDVSAFVEVFRKRGLILNGKPDMANKMFVTMRFVKSLGARMEKGNGGRVAEGRNENMGRSDTYAKTKFVDDDVEEVDESKVLKPCVYKTR
ncbi:hypothetical protein HO133_010021 [Letharia lupina]|uniref:Ribosomal RNA-processing protein 8 n=1 Tax=Letharia lupina TaxID=560253 RepID=A0A8H6FDT9_9LECA|nr:uncharacterized protein HO133_010021 [Letharia lupina]KAF6224827.1 hypothetical protein HO133_010021 [Letharia lupina]